jgi:pyridoxal phosphate enzyme (YggS family)
MSLLRSDQQSPLPTLQDRLTNIKERIARAAAKSGRSASDVRIIAVTKTVCADVINEIVALGVRDIAESRVQEAIEKSRQILKTQPSLQKHFIGHLQTNKARKAVELFDVIQSVDSVRLAETLNRAADERGQAKDCLVELKLSTEPSKSGLSIRDAVDLIDSFGRFTSLRLRGVMTIAPNQVSVEETRACFRELCAFANENANRFPSAPEISMGMSDDFEIAVEEGATMVRIGRALFGERR